MLLCLFMKMMCIRMNALANTSAFSKRVNAMVIFEIRLLIANVPALTHKLDFELQSLFILEPTRFIDSCGNNSSYRDSLIGVRTFEINSN